jgi:hypothetical protein
MSAMAKIQSDEEETMDSIVNPKSGVTDEQLLKTWAAEIRNRLYSPLQKGCPDINPDNGTWRYSFTPKGLLSMKVEEVQALMRMFGLEELEGVKPGGDCGDCIHGRHVSSSCGFWPTIDDCYGCLDPMHQHFISTDDLHLYENIKRDNVFRIPTGGTIPIYIERLKKGMEGPFEYYEARGNFVYRVSDEKRICLMSSLRQLHLPGNKRHDL